MAVRVVAQRNSRRCRFCGLVLLRLIDGLPGDEHPFLACTFWLVEQYASSGRLDDADELMNRACAVANDVGLLSEEYDVGRDRHAGNTPQALSHLALVRAADALVGHSGRAAYRV